MKKYYVLIYVILSFLLLFSFLGDNKHKEENVYEVKAEVLEVNNDNMIVSGITALGSQQLKLKILNGDFKGKEVDATNNLTGKLDYDNYYKVGDKIIAALLIKDNKIYSAKSVDLFRQDLLGLLFILFIILLIIYAQKIGIMAIFSFVSTLFVLWKILIPFLLKGKDPIIMTIITLIILSGIIIFSVAGITKKAISAFLGTMAGLLISLIFTIFIGERLGLMGMTSPYAESIVYSGYFNLNMKYIFYAAVIIGSSGAAMDIAMDISSAVCELNKKRPDLEKKELIKSGLTVGRDVIGTMTTTLLLAYSGSFLTLLMLFQIRANSLTRVINMKIVTAEIMRTVIGSLALVLVAPTTAIISGILFSSNKILHQIKNN